MMSTTEVAAEILAVAGVLHAISDMVDELGRQMPGKVDRTLPWKLMNLIARVCAMRGGGVWGK